jgi:hypothetical protein
MRWLLVLVLSATCFAQQPERVVTPGFVALNAAAFGAAALDVTTTRRCIDANTCHEANPLMQGSAGRQYSIALSTAAAGTLIDYAMEKHGHRVGRLVPWIVMGVHGFGAGMALRF